jgi:hypothetical protein
LVFWDKQWTVKIFLILCVLYNVCIYQLLSFSKQGAWGASLLPVFDQIVNPISTRRANYAHHRNTAITSLPGFLDLATALSLKTMKLHMLLTIMTTE